MVHLSSLLLFGFVSLTSIWSTVCLRRNALSKKGSSFSSDKALLSDSRIDSLGRLTMTPPLEQLKAADF